MNDFIDWEKSKREEIEYVVGLMSKELSDEPIELINDLFQIEAWNTRIGVLLAQADSFLDRYTYIYMPVRDGDRTEADRKAFVDNSMTPIRQVRDTLERICDSIKQRLILGESVLSYFKVQYPERKV